MIVALVLDRDIFGLPESLSSRFPSGLLVLPIGDLRKIRIAFKNVHWSIHRMPGIVFRRTTDYALISYPLMFCSSYQDQPSIGLRRHSGNNSDKTQIR